MSIIKEMWYCNINPQESMKTDDPALGKPAECMVRHMNEMKIMLSGEQKAELEKNIDCRNEYKSLY